MEERANEDNFKRPFPALTPAERYHLDVFGYVIIENTLTQEEVGSFLKALQKLKQDFLLEDDPANATVRGCHLANYQTHFMHFAHYLEADPTLIHYPTHPRLVGMAEELVGGSVRLEETEAIINSRNPGVDFDQPLRYGFHTGTRPGFGTYNEHGLYHCNLVKTITNLTELGPDDGGTMVIAGSHKVNCSEEDIIACAYEDPNLIHQVVAPAGSTLFFSESLIHATGHIRSDRERAIIISGYTPPMFQAWNGQEPSPEFVEQAPESLRPLISGSDKWTWKQRHRTLNMPAEA